MPKYYPFGRKTILLDIITLVTKFIFLDEKNHMQKTSIVEKTLNQTKHSLKKPNLIMMEKDVIGIHYPKMCIKIRCYVHTNLSLHKKCT